MSSTDGWIKKMWPACIQWNTIQTKKKEILLSVTTWMNLEGITPSAIKPEKDKQCTISCICGI